MYMYERLVGCTPTPPPPPSLSLSLSHFLQNNVKI